MNKNRTKLDADSKKWRFFADVLNDCAMALELLAPTLVELVDGGAGNSNVWMSGVLCVSGAAKSVVGVAGGATRAALTQHQVSQFDSYRLEIELFKSIHSFAG